jgi:hypothetical protein
MYSKGREEKELNNQLRCTPSGRWGIFIFILDIR